jgi:drug/metabolite transporter (DMT)-like permease
MLVASGVAAIYIIASRRPLPSRRDWPAFFLMGLLGLAIYNVALGIGEQRVSAGAASFLINTAPVFSVLLAIVFLGERLTGSGWLGVVISLGGATLIAMGEGTSGGRGLLSPDALLILLAALCASVFLTIQKSVLKRYNAMETTAFVIWAATLWLLPFGSGLMETIRTAPPLATLAVAYMGVFPAAVAYALWAYVLSQWPASRTASFLYLVPPIVLVMSWLWLGEVPALLSVIGGFVTLTGVILVNTRGKWQPQIIDKADSNR